MRVADDGRTIEASEPRGALARYEAMSHTALAQAASRRSGAALSRRGFMGAALALACAGALPWLSGCSSGQADGSAGDGAQGAPDRGVTGSVTPDDQVQSTTAFLFDTVIEIKAACDAETIERVSQRMQYFEGKFSRTIEGTDIWNINAAGGAPVEVAPETADIITRAIAFSEESGGLFDISIGAVSSLWDFVNAVKPSDEAIAEAVKHVDYRTITVDGTTVTLSDPKAMLDLGGIAKGYITDDLVGILHDGGCKDAFLNLGGNVYVMGNSFDGDEWNVGVQDPNGQFNDGIASIKCADTSVVTSGLYERSFTQDGVLYYHILDPKTGYPVKTDLESASITCEESTRGDAYSTILFLMGHDAAMDLINSDDRLQGVLVDDNGVATTSEGSDFVLL